MIDLLMLSPSINGMKQRLICAVLLLMYLLCSCKPSDFRQTAQEDIVDAHRTGIISQGTTALQNGVEITASGIYFLAPVDNGVFLLYADHASDKAVKLCGRPDCPHTDITCNAYFANADNICYFDGFLYTETGFGASIQITRMNLDGTERTVVWEANELSSGYRGSNGVYIANGLCFFSLYRLDSDGNEISDPYYWKLDGSMEKAAPVQGLSMLYNHGSAFLLKGDAHTQEQSRFGLYHWNPDSNDSLYLTDVPYERLGYWGTEAGYYVEQGNIYKVTYSDGSIELMLDTQLDGEYRLHCFPDCMMLSEYIPWEEQEFRTLTTQTLRFYSWDGGYIGKAVLDYPVYGPINYANTVCGESSGKIYLAAHFYGTPEYYIDKAELSEGTAAVHQLFLPEDISAYYHSWE